MVPAPVSRRVGAEESRKVPILPRGDRPGRGGKFLHGAEAGRSRGSVGVDEGIDEPAVGVGAQDEVMGDPPRSARKRSGCGCFCSRGRVRSLLPACRPPRPRSSTSWKRAVKRKTGFWRARSARGKVSPSHFSTRSPSINLRNWLARLVLSRAETSLAPPGGRATTHRGSRSSGRRRDRQRAGAREARSS